MSEAVLRAVFVADERAFTGARCELPLGEVVEVAGRKTPFFALCRELDKRGYGDCRIQISTPEGTPSRRRDRQGARSRLRGHPDTGERREARQ